MAVGTASLLAGLVEVLARLLGVGIPDRRLADAGPAELGGTEMLVCLVCGVLG